MKDIWIPWLAALAAIALGVGLTYLIGSSDLPDWVKFLLLG